MTNQEIYFPIGFAKEVKALKNSAMRQRNETKSYNNI